MVELTILSPHRDDAAFSLGVALSRWKTLPIKLTVVNFFTISEYGPHVLSTRTSTIAALRAKEDRSALYSIDKRLRVEALDLLDAPLRLGISIEAICRPEASALQSGPEVEMLVAGMRKYFARGLVLAPLGLGDHVDHLAVKTAAIASSVEHRLGFYEDLPYGTWTSNLSLCSKVQEAEKVLKVSLRSTVIRNHRFAVTRKRQIINKYQSQISFQEATVIARYAWNYRGGERIWIPKYGLSWRRLLS